MVKGLRVCNMYIIQRSNFPCTVGTCLTATEFDKDSFKVGVAPETLRCTNLGKYRALQCTTRRRKTNSASIGDLKVGEKVNLERAMDSKKRFGGHMVQGHVDNTVKIIEIKPEGNSIWYHFQMEESDKDKMRYVIPKGYVCLDGTSLTVCDVNDEERTFSIMMIAHTQANVIMPSKKVGDRVNVEVDMLAKYALKSLEDAIKSNQGIEALVKRVLKD
jgi:riboflavin synthase